MFPECLKKVLDFIWQDMVCDTARLNLYHIKNEDGNINADSEIKGWLAMDRKGFKSV